MNLDRTSALLTSRALPGAVWKMREVGRAVWGCDLEFSDPKPQMSSVAWPSCVGRSLATGLQARQAVLASELARSLLAALA